ncbi:MAG: hypothetical protein ACRDG8_05340 [Actinomycetota bacterium]
MRAIDLAYHVRVGELALRSGDVIRTDMFTFTRGGFPWLNQQWGAQVIFALAHRALGWAGVAITHAAAVGTGILFVYRSCVRAGAHPRTSAVLSLLGFLVGAGSLAARPQSLAIPLFTGTWLLLGRRSRWIWLVPVLAVVWANVHGSFVLAPLLTAFALADDVADRKPAGRSLLLLLATVAGTLVSPFGPSVWSYAVEIAGNETIRSSVAEWRPPLPFTVRGAPFWFSGIAVAVLGVSKRRAVRPVDAIRLLAFFALGLPALRATLWWALAAPPIVASWYRRADRTPSAGTGRSALDRTAAAILLALLPISLLARAGIDPVTGAPVRLARDAPEVLVDATRRSLPRGSRLFVFQPFASWFEFSLPEDPVMVDSKVELFPAAVWRDYARVISARDGWERVLDRYTIQGVILEPGAVLTDELLVSDGWERIAVGPAGSVFVRA